jgi:hypothetical protein
MHCLLKRIAPFVIVISLVNCEDPVDLKLGQTGGVLVVNGKVSTLLGPQRVALGYTSSNNQIPDPATGAAIVLYGNSGSSQSYSEVQPGVYQIDATSFSATPGERYFIEIQLPNGKTYRSRPELLPLSMPKDSTYYEFYQKTRFEGGVQLKSSIIAIFADTHVAPSDSPLFLRWDAEEIYMFEETPVPNPLTGTIPLPCFVTGYPDPQRINIFSGAAGSDLKLLHNLVAEREIDNTFLARHYFIVNASSISADAYLYWRQVNGLINKTGSLFDTPPAPVRGNVYNVEDQQEQVLGFFEVSNTTVSRIFTVRANIPFPVPFNCYVPEKGLYSQDYPPPCYDCLRLSNSSHEKPDWF